MTDPAVVLAALRDGLLAAGTPPESFQLAGVHENTPLPTDFWFVRPGDGGWEVGAYERGRYEVRASFDAVDDAAAFLRGVV